MSFGVILRMGIMVTVNVYSRIIVRRTLHDFYCPYFSPEVMVKFTRRVMGHLVKLI